MGPRAWLKNFKDTREQTDRQSHKLLYYIDNKVSHFRKLSDLTSNVSSFNDLILTKVCNLLLNRLHILLHYLHTTDLNINKPDSRWTKSVEDGASHL